MDNPPTGVVTILRSTHRLDLKSIGRFAPRTGIEVVLGEERIFLAGISRVTWQTHSPQLVPSQHH